MTDKLSSALGFIVALTLLSGVTWLILSAIASFIHLDWVACTSNALGRGGFAFIVCWLAWTMLREDRA